MRSRERTVSDDLPPWCRMSGHEYLGKLPGEGYARYFMRKGRGVQEEEATLEKDKEEARKYRWRLRARATGHLKSTVYARNFAFDVGQATSFEEKDAHPCALEYLFGALARSLTSSVTMECARDNLEVDDIETCIGKLSRREPLALGDLQFLRTVTKKPIKITLPGPYLLTR